ncbi:hypothetical protein [Pseudoalteromonas ruthenica]|uniref:hypothetical protein n=1 Tax=Pseudoalteromonas ruthenica TaxID=151081 RepID=UPI00110AB5D3|nr:hypothetical protein [Pseudoalteromonas ruthenica]TMO87694.1 hypothetical protein CWC12_10475 [Pseudoalteromonas ruthenica]TMP21499.1 hypothetical protein CWC06_18300 [Pseudoalteromonas ruthenica]
MSKLYAIVKGGKVVNAGAIADTPLNSSWVEIPAGVVVKVGYAFDGTTFFDDTPPQEEPYPYINISLQNISVTSSSGEKKGNIWWIPVNEPFTIRAEAVEFADTVNEEMMIMIERIIGGEKPVEDLRFKAKINQGLIEINVNFNASGNYIITAERLNAGLKEIGEAFRLSFPKLEFDVYVA